MDIILIPGFWLDGSSWSGVAPALGQACHRVRALTLPGLESRDADRRGIRLRDHVAAVVAAVDEVGAPVVLVGHSGGGAIAHAAADARPDPDDELREAFRARAVPEPAAVATDLQELHDDRRYGVRATIIASTFPSEQLREWVKQGHPYVAELASMREVEYVDLPTGHWPQFTKPAELREAIVEA